jgi:propionyl-CoA synthetase
VDGGRADQVALIYDSPVAPTIQKFTYRILLDKTARLAGGLQARGIRHGDRVVIYMPAVPEAVIAMLACARLGAIQSVVFGGFAANELATRIDDAQPKAIISASCGIEGSRHIAYKPILDAAINLAVHQPDFCIMLQRPQLPANMVPGRDVDWRDANVSSARPSMPPIRYILYTSGTTGAPKGVVRDNGGHAVVLNWRMGNIYATQPGETFWAASDIGWQVGHSYITYGPLLHGATMLLFEGKPVGTPDPRHS